MSYRIDFSRYGTSQKIQAVTTTYNWQTRTLVDNLSYNPFGRPRGLDTGSGGAVSNKSGDCNCLEGINPGAMMEQNYSYDDNGNLFAVSAPTPPGWISASTTMPKTVWSAPSAPTGRSATPMTGSATAPAAPSTGRPTPTATSPAPTGLRRSAARTRPPSATMPTAISRLSTAEPFFIARTTG